MKAKKIWVHTYDAGENIAISSIEKAEEAMLSFFPGEIVHTTETQIGIIVEWRHESGEVEEFSFYLTSLY